jgi:predicted TIM-barrel fold metal-dependent hydrolase
MTTAILDAHVHFWDPAALQYPWLDDLAALQRSFLPVDYSAAIGGLAVSRCVVVEGNCLPEQSVREVQYFEHLAGADPRIGGIVAFAELTERATLMRTLDCLTNIRLVKGVRQNIQRQQRGFALQRAFVEGVREVGARGWTFDLCVTHDQLGEAIALVEQCPDTRFVLDHCAKPAIRTGERDPWREDLGRLAAHENVCCKISGLLTEADLDHWRDGDLLPYAEHTVECFGIDRVLYGSDWPVLTLGGDYERWFDFTVRFTESWSHHERCRFYAENAARLYRVELPTP